MMFAQEADKIIGFQSLKLIAPYNVYDVPNGRVTRTNSLWIWSEQVLVVYYLIKALQYLRWPSYALSMRLSRRTTRVVWLINPHWVLLITANWEQSSQKRFLFLRANQ